MKVNRLQAKKGSPAIHLNFADFWSRQWGVPYQEREQEKSTEQKIQEERESFLLANPKAIQVIAKIAALGICLILNWNFWTRVLPGAFGYLIATLATIAEIMVFVCWMSIGSARLAASACSAARK